MTDRGSISVEMVILAPAFVLFFALIVVAGRVQSNTAEVEAAARSAARSLTLSRDPHEAVAIARADTHDRLDVGAPSCRDMAWDARITTTDVTVTISCEVDLEAAAALPIPGTFRVSASSTETLDRFIEGA